MNREDFIKNNSKDLYGYLNELSEPIEYEHLLEYQKSIISKRLIGEFFTEGKKERIIKISASFLEASLDELLYSGLIRELNGSDNYLAFALDEGEGFDNKSDGEKTA